MEAQQIDADRFGNEFPESTKISEGISIEVMKIENFKTDKGLEGVSLTAKDGGLFHTTAKQPVGYIRSPNVGLDALIKKATDSAVTLYFYSEKPTNSQFAKMLKCSVFKQ
jgi:uncharacterized protein YjiK